MIPSRRSPLVALLALLLLGVGSCASIPEYTEPHPLKRIEESNSSPQVRPPAPNLDSFGIVRSFIDAGAAPASNHRAARLHLTRAARSGWKVPETTLVVTDVDTIPVTRPPGTPRGTQIVRVRADKVGYLRPDQSFQPADGEYSADIRVRWETGYGRKQGAGNRGGRWRIVDPPRELVASRGSFLGHYLQVPIYFVNHDATGVVPDLRYVVARPSSNLPRRVIDLLLAGPSEGVRSAMGTAIPEGAHPATNPSESSDGALAVNLSDLNNPPPQTRRLIAAQVVLSLQRVSSARVRLQEEGTALLPDSPEVLPSDVSSLEAPSSPSPELPGLAVVDERVHMLDSGAQPIAGPAGSGAYNVVRAAQSADGSQLAAVVRKPQGGAGLRIGQFGGALREAPVSGSDMTAPTWRGGSELWTVVDQRDLVRVLNDGDQWVPQHIDVRQFSGGRPITALRLSHDGTRVAAVVDGRIVVASVANSDGDVTLQHPVELSGNPRDTKITGVEWLSNDSLVATTRSSSAPVVEVSVDGFRWTRYASANLVQPLSSLTVAAGRRVVVADANGLWEASSQRDLWALLPVPIGSSSIPFFPG